MALARLNSEEAMEDVLMGAGRPEAILLVLVHSCARLRSSNIGEVSHFVKLLLEFVVALALTRESKVCWVGLIASVRPLRLGCIACDKLFLLLFRLKDFELLDDCDGTSVPDMLHQSDSFL